MSQDRTHGYDIVLELSDQVVNDLLPVEPFPPQRGARIDMPIGPARLTGEPEIFFPVEPTARLLQFDLSIPDGLAISTPFSLGNVVVSWPGREPQAVGINGTLRVLNPISAYTDDLGRRCLGLDFSAMPIEHVSVDVTSATPSLPELPAERFLQQLLHAFLQNTVRRLTLFGVRLPDNDDPLTPDDFDVRVVTEDCVALLISTTTARTRDRNAFTRSEIPPGANATILVSSYTLLWHVACPGIMQYLGLEGNTEDYFDYSDGAVRLRTSTSLSHLVDHPLVDEVRLETLRIVTEEGSIRCETTMRASGFGYHASARLIGSLNVRTTDDGEVLVDSEVHAADVDLVVYPWVWLLIVLGIALVPTIGGIVGLLLPVLAALVDPIVELLAHRFIDVSATAQLPHLLPVVINSVVLDDLQLSGRAVTPERRRLRGPTLWLEGEIEVTGTGHGGGRTWEVVPGVTATSFSVTRAHRVRYRAETDRMMFPVAFEWWLDDHTLSGEGTVDMGPIRVRYAVERHHCELFLATGDSLTATLYVRGIAANGVVLTDEVLLDIEGVTEIRSFHGVELIEGPSVLGIINALTAGGLDLPSRTAGAHERLHEEARTRSRPSLISEQKTALMTGMGIDLPPETFH